MLTISRITPLNLRSGICLLFCIAGIFCIVHTRNEGVKDFGNYYYGSKLLSEGKFDLGVYTDIHHFNAQIRQYGETDYFENYSPVPPFSALFYLPFTLFSSLNAKLLFNVLSLFIFCISFFRLLKFLDITSRMLLLLPLVFLFPLYNNILQGQAYLLVASLLFEIFILSERKKTVLPAFLMALIVSLKIFPAIILVFFVLTRNYRSLRYFLLFMGFLWGLTFFVLPDESLFYCVEVLPRLFNNDVVGPYYHGNQSLYSFLLCSFTKDDMVNAEPFVDAPLLVNLFESLLNSLCLVFLWQMRNKPGFIVYGLTCLSGILLTRYTTSYGMLLLLPFAILVMTEQASAWKIIVLFLLFVSVSWPLSGAITGITFFRLFGLLTTLALAISYYRPRVKLKALALMFIPLFIFRLFTFSVKPVDYFAIQNTKGILYDLELKPDTLTLLSTLGSSDLSESFKLEGSYTNSGLDVRDRTIYYKGKPFYQSRDNKKNPFIYNDTNLVFMSDLNQGFGFYKLRRIPFTVK